MSDRIKQSLKETKLLFKEIPLYILITFFISVIGMNILANFTIYQSEFLAIDAGFTISWIVFIVMDLITIHFGVKAIIKLSIFAILINIITSLIFIPIALFTNSNIFGTWFTCISSSIAFIVSAIINSFLNYLFGKLFKNNPDGKLAFICRTNISTLIGQFIDNLIFATLTFMVFAPKFWNGFSWSITQCLTCSILFAVIETVVEIIFTPIAYKISKQWKKKGIGEKYRSLNIKKAC